MALEVKVFGAESSFSHTRYKRRISTVCQGISGAFWLI